MSGHRAQAVTIIDLAVAYPETHRELLFLPDLLRLRGDYTDDAASYEQAYDRALALDMPLIALRAATKLRDRVRIHAALSLCAEPGDMPDVVEARVALG